MYDTYDAINDGWWLPIADDSKQPARGFRWTTDRLTPDAVRQRILEGKRIGLRPFSLGMVCVDVDHEGPDRRCSSLPYRSTLPRKDDTSFSDTTARSSRIPTGNWAR